MKHKIQEFVGERGTDQMDQPAEKYPDEDEENKHETETLRQNRKWGVIKKDIPLKCLAEFTETAKRKDT